MFAAAINWRILCGRSRPAACGARAPASAIPAMIPAGHTDLVLPAIGEEWGFVGVLAVVLLFVFLVQRCYRDRARRAPTSTACSWRWRWAV